MLRRLLTPGWLALHVLAFAAAYAMFRLGLWQWHRGLETHRVQNYSYGIEWWVFAVFALFLWAKTIVDSLEEGEDEPEEPVAAATAPEPAPLPVVDEDEDPELAAYNRHLAALHAQSQREQ